MDPEKRSTRHAVTFSDNTDHDFDIRAMLGQGIEGASEPGEVLAATAGLGKQDHAGWHAAWLGLAQRTEQTAQACAQAGHRVSAAAAQLRASNYFGAAVNAMSALPEVDDLTAMFRLQQQAWDSFVELIDIPVERVDIPYQDATLPGYFFAPAEGAATGPALIVVNGSDGSLAGLWGSCVAAGLRRGYRVLVFDGPGQQSQLFERGVGFRPDWEHVLTPVHDFVARRSDVDPARIAVYGISQGGYWVTRALAFEQRFVGAIVDPGVLDVSASWTSHLPKSLLHLLDEGKDEQFDRDMRIGMKLSPQTAHTWRFRARPYGTTGYADTIRAVREYNATDVADRIRTPLLITAPEQEQFWPGQSERLAELAAPVATLVRFTAAEGAAGHCQPLARGLTAQRMFDWLDDRLAAPPASS